jgi:hypothetical protein
MCVKAPDSKSIHYLFLQMTMLILLQIAALAFVGVNAQVTETVMRDLLTAYDLRSKELCNTQAKANWEVQTDNGNATKEAAQVSEERREKSGLKVKIIIVQA